MKDPIVEEIRGFRDEHAKKFNYNLDAICEDYKAHQLNCGYKLVKLKPKKIANKALQPTPKTARLSLFVMFQEREVMRHEYERNHGIN